MKFKKLLSFVLSAAIVVTMAGCGGTNDAPSTDLTADSSQTGAQGADAENDGDGAAGIIDFDEDPYLLHICYAVAGEAQPDLPMIQEKLNEIALREINVQVELEAVSLFTIANVYALKASSGEKNDLMIMFPGYNYLTSFANSNMIMPIEDYVNKWGTGLQEGLGELMKVGEFKDHLYAIPQNTGQKANATGFCVSTELCEKYDIEPASIKTLEDLEAAFAVIKENEPEVTVVMSEVSGGAILTGLVDYYDGLGTGGGVLEVQEDGSLKVVNQLEQESYRKACEKVREWYEVGYISKDVLTTQDAGFTAQTNGKCFAVVSSSIGPSADYFYETVVLRDSAPIVTTQSSQMLMWAVAASCERPDKAIQFLNMCFESEEVANLMLYGVEDVHYSILENGTVDTSLSEDWQNYWNMLGDFNNQYVKKDLLEATPGAETVEDYRRIYGEWETEYSPAYGFVFDPTNVKTEIAACDAVNNEYQLVIGNGTVEVESELQKWIDKLYDAGLQKVLDEKQAQLDAWVAAQ